MKPVPHGEPYAGKLHVRFDEGAGVPDNKGRSALLYTPWDVRFTGLSAVPSIETGVAFAAGSLGVWELRRETAGGRMRPASDTARRDVSPLLGEAGMLQGQTWLPQ